MKSSKTNGSVEINWAVREIFSEAALVSFWNEINRRHLEREENED
ncbi:hypothetical protein [Prochlorococcus sp. MIT 0916]